MSVSDINDIACKCTENPEKPTANADIASLMGALRSTVLDKMSVAVPTSKKGTVKR